MSPNNDGHFDGPGAPISGRYKLVPDDENTPPDKIEHKKVSSTKDWRNIILLVAAAVGLTQALNSLGPCNTEWKFPTKVEVVKLVEEESTANKADHTAIRKETSDAVSSVRNDIRQSQKMIIEAITNRPKKLGRDNQ